MKIVSFGLGLAATAYAISGNPQPQVDTRLPFEVDRDADLELIKAMQAGMVAKAKDMHPVHLESVRRELLLNQLGCVWDCLTSDTAACIACADEHFPIGQLRTSYTKDMLQFKLGTGYTEGWCGSRSHHPEEGVDIEQYPSGWRPNGDGTYTGCETSTDFPGLHTTSHQSHAYVKEEMQTLPALQNSGTVWRGNELGFIISNELFWPFTKPKSVLLGSTVNQHKVLRPILTRLFSTCDNDCYEGLSASARELQSKNSLRVQADIKIWVHQELFKIIFPDEGFVIDAEEFVGTQTSFTTLSTITQLLPDEITQLIASSTIDNLRNYFNALRPLVEKHYGDEVGHLDCSPTPNCVDQLTSAFLDTLVAAGGLSVPGAISTGLWVMYGQTEEYGDMFPQKYRLNPEYNDVTPFFYESMRFFAPVVGLPWWTTPPARATDPEGSQMEGGVRKVLNLALANKDPNAWGADADKFRVRPLAKYHQDFLGFADFAVDDSVAGGAMNRKCPGKDLALKMGKAFFQNWDQLEWQTNDDSKYTEATPFIDEFVLEKPKAINFWNRIWEDVVAQGHLLVNADGRFDQYTRTMSALNSYEVLSWPYPTAEDIVRPKHHEVKLKVPMGLADEIEVPKDDEGWAEVEHTAAFVQSQVAKLLSFPESADDCGEWNDGEDAEQALQDLLFSGVNPKRILTPWNEEKYTDEGLEDLVFGGIGQHRIQRVRPGDDKAEGATYAVYLGAAASFSVKPGFAKLGADAYFNADGKILHIVRGGQTFYPDGEQGFEAYTRSSSESTCSQLGGDFECNWTCTFWNWWSWFGYASDGTCKVPAKVGWRQTKMAFLGTLSAYITGVDHLYGLHLLVSNAIVTANVEELEPEHPLRQLMHPFSFRTAAINWKASFALVNEFGLLHRAMPLDTAGLESLYAYARTESSGLTWRTIDERHAGQNIGLIGGKQLPLHEDGADFYRIIQTFVRGYLTNHYDYTSNACKADEGVRRWYEAVNRIAPNHDLPPADTITCESLEGLLSTFIYYVTAGHNHVGAMVSEVEDPCHAPWGWREGELCGTPRTTFTQLLTFALTSLEQPKLKDDYTHLFEAEADKKVWRDLQSDLEAFQNVVDERNTHRKRPFRSYDPRYLEISVGI